MPRLSLPLPSGDNQGLCMYVTLEEAGTAEARERHVGGSLIGDNDSVSSLSSCEDTAMSHSTSIEEGDQGEGGRQTGWQQSSRSLRRS